VPRYRNKLKKIFSDEALQAATFDATEERYIHLQKRSLEVHKQATEAINLISSGTLELWYQPQICMKTMKVHGFEALLRLRMPNGKSSVPHSSTNCKMPATRMRLITGSSNKRSMTCGRGNNKDSNRVSAST